MQRHKQQPAVYIRANKRNETLYTGVTSNLLERIYQHKMWEAIAREKQIKGGSRKKKIALIESVNPQWKGLYEHLGL